jgi:hypothetical protein
MILHVLGLFLKSPDSTNRLNLSTVVLWTEKLCRLVGKHQLSVEYTASTFRAKDTGSMLFR